MRSFIAILAGGVALALSPTAASGVPIVKTLLNFNTNDGAEPYGRMVFDSKGNLYGDLSIGGKATAKNPYPAGALFRLAPPAGAKGWIQTVLYTFIGGADGAQPTGGLLADTAGNLYGTTFLGGADGDGTVFKLFKPATGKHFWKKRILHSFTGADGNQPFAGLVGDKNGNLYGVTTAGGQFNQGAVFELTAKTFVESVLYSFQGPEGTTPYGGLAIDSAGNLFGTTSTTNTAPYAGSVFELSPPPAGQTVWSFTELHAFTGGADGGAPQGAMVASPGGNIFGATFGGTGMGNGTVFELSPSAGSPTGYSYQVIFTFTGAQGSNPFGDLALDSAGKLWGTLLNSSDVNSSGGLFVLSPPADGDGTWVQYASYLFNGSTGGYSPYAGMVLDSAGNGYGTDFTGGNFDVGTVYKFVP
jgi:uncharacterized repeat protein (TIGR03803 family)